LIGGLIQSANGVRGIVEFSSGAAELSGVDY
jgi:hypothetical protein